MRPRTLLERDAELAALSALLARAAAGKGGAALVEGEAGIGKSSLIDTVSDAAADAGFRVLRAVGTPVETAYALGGIKQLFESYLRDLPAMERDQLLRGPAAHVAKVFELSDEPVPGKVDEFSLCHGFYWLIDAMARSDPFLIVLDDAQWMDAVSLRVVIYAARRIADLGVAVVAGWRTGEPHHLTELDVVRDLPTVTRLEPRPLTRAATAEVLSFDHDGDSTRLLNACYTASGGNPFLVAELADTVRPDTDPDDVASLSPVGLIRSLTSRLQHLPPAAGAVAEAVSVLDADADLRCVAAVAGLDPPTTLRAADILAEARLFAPDGRLAFRHPLLRAAVYRATQPGARSIAHLAAARALAVDGPHRDRAAGHLLLVNPAGDPWVVAELRTAAARALAAGAPTAAIPLLERALAEPAGDATAEVLAELGHATLLTAAGDPVPLLRRALATTEDPSVRRRAATDLSHALAAVDRTPEAITVLREQAGLLDATAPALAFELRSLMALGLEDLRTTSWTAENATSMVEAGVPDTAGGHRVLLTHTYGCALASRGVAAQVAQQAEPALGESWWREHPGAAVTALYGGLATMLWTGQVERAARLARQVLRDAELAGDHLRVAAASSWLSHALCLLGDLAAADDAARRGAEGGAPSPLFRRLTLAIWLQALTARGRLDEADQALADFPGGEVATTLSGAWLTYARCGLHIARGRAEEAAADATALLSYQSARGGTPPGWGWPVVKGLTLGGQYDLAVAVAEGVVAQATRWGEPGALGVALRDAGRIGTGKAALDQLHAGVELLEGSVLRLELAVARAELGAALRRDGHRNDARRVLTEAVDLAHRCGARPVLERAQDELRLAGGRPRRLATTGVEALTPAEYRVARQAADGLTNTEVCQALFLTRSTVEKHLSSVYRKLDISSRDQLAGLLGSPGA